MLQSTSSSGEDSRLRWLHAEVLTSHAHNNVTENIFAKIGANLHLRKDHPICMVKDTIYSYFDKLSPGLYEKFDDLKPVVSTTAVRAPRRSPLICAHASLYAWQACGHANMQQVFSSLELHLPPHFLALAVLVLPTAQSVEKGL